MNTFLTRLVSTTSRRSFATSTSTTSYTVQRQPESGWLPVYRDYRRSNNMVKSTIIKRVEGDAEKLLKDLSETLKTQGLVNKRNGNVELKGDQLHAVRDFLTARGF
ncbi:hypothetical protein HDU79_009070 [Rhizoclosmatium sp. JEL0117]|nr:hypothetical protein HDU79_009070 [Rhizoclosmatium sp. JEL0117]